MSEHDEPTTEEVLEEIFRHLREPCTLADAREARIVLTQHLNRIKKQRVRDVRASVPGREAAWREALEYVNKVCIQNSNLPSRPFHVPSAIEHLRASPESERSNNGE